MDEGAGLCPDGVEGEEPEEEREVAEEEREEPVEERRGPEEERDGSEEGRDAPEEERDGVEEDGAWRFVPGCPPFREPLREGSAGVCGARVGENLPRFRGGCCSDMRGERPSLPWEESCSRGLAA